MDLQIVCKLCDKQFSEANMPRLLPKCFHSYCQNCLKNKIESCPSDSIKIICPIDYIQCHFDDKDINNFPKNISLIKKFRKHSISKSRQQSVANQSHNQDSIRYLAKTIYQTTNPPSNLNSSINSKDISREESKIIEPDFCTIHDKPMDIICIRDSNIICSNCALFGIHKNHEFKGIDQVQKEKEKRYHEIINLIDQRERLETKISGKESKLQFSKYFNNKKQCLINQVHQKYLKLFEILRNSQIKCLQSINKNYEIIEEKLKNQVKILEKPNQIYKLWLEKAFKQIQSFDTIDNLKQQLFYLNYQQNPDKMNIVKQGQIIIKQIEKANKQLHLYKREVVESLTYEYNKQIEDKLLEIIKITFKTNNDALEKQFSKQNISQINNTKQLSNTSAVEELAFKESESTLSANNIKKYRNKQLFIKLDQRKNQLNQILKIQKSPKIEKKSLMRSLVISPKKQQSMLTQFKRKLKVKIPQKYDKMIQSIIFENLEVLDLTNAELGEQVVIQILELIRLKKVKVVRLGKNKLTDDCISYLWLYLGSVISLNLSQNFFTEKMIDNIIMNSKKTPNIKNIILTQNKIKEKNVKNKLEQIKKLDIIVSI